MSKIESSYAYNFIRGANVNAASKVGESILAHAVKYRCSYSVIQTIVAKYVAIF